MQALAEAPPELGIVPEADLRVRPADHFRPPVAGIAEEGVVDLEHPSVREPTDRHRGRVGAEGFREALVESGPRRGSAAARPLGFASDHQRVAS